MSHEVEQMTYFGATPWHGLGTPMGEDELYSIPACMEKAGLNWGVEKTRIGVWTGEKNLSDYLPDEWEQMEGLNDEIIPTYAEIKTHFAMRRTSDNSILGVVGQRYKPLQNIAAFEWFQPFLDTKSAAFHTAGSLSNGQRVWILAQLNSENSEVVKGDDISKFLLLSNSHDGTMAVRVGFTPIRVVCANTMAMAHRSDASKLIRLKHSAKLSENMEKIREIMDLANQEFSATVEQYKFLANKTVHQGDLHKYVKILQGVGDKSDSDLSTRISNLIKKIKSLFVSGKGNDLEGVRGTWWAAYNAYTEFLSWEDCRNDNNRMASVWFGPNVGVNKTALELALTMADK